MKWPTPAGAAKAAHVLATLAALALAVAGSPECAGVLARHLVAVQLEAAPLRS